MTIRRLVSLATFTSLMVVMSYIKIPVYPVVFTLQTFIVILVGLIFKPIDAALVILTYLILGLIGIPVFTTGGGFQAFASPTGGFLIALFFAGTFISVFKSKHKNKIKDLLVIFIFGFILLYAIAIPFFMVATNLSLMSSLIAFLPYYFWDIVKLICAYFVYLAIPDYIINDYKR